MLVFARMEGNRFFAFVGSASRDEAADRYGLQPVVAGAVLQGQGPAKEGWRRCVVKTRALPGTNCLGEVLLCQKGSASEAGCLRYIGW